MLSIEGRQKRTRFGALEPAFLEDRYRDPATFPANSTFEFRIMLPMSRTWPLRLAIVCVPCAALIAGFGCGGADGSTVGRMKTAFYGSVNSSALDALEDVVDVNGTSAIGEAEVLVVDCDQWSASSLRNDEVIRQFLSNGRTVIFTDVTADHKVEGIKPHMKSVMPGMSYVCLARRSRDKFGRPEFFMLDFPHKEGAGDPTYAELVAFRHAAGEFFSPTRSRSNPDFNPPPGLIYVIYNFSIPTQSLPITGTKHDSSDQHTTQNTSAVFNFTYTLFLENGNNATGDQQYLAIDTNIEMSPLNEALGTTKMIQDKTGNSFEGSNIGWFQTQCSSSIVPSNQSSFQYQSDSPANANNVTQVTSAISFGLTFANPQSSGGGSFTYSDSESQYLTSWKVDNLSSGAFGSWQWINQDPWMFNDPSKWGGHGFGGGLHGFGEFREPNDLAESQMVADAKIAYSTAGTLLSSTETFNHETEISYLNVWDDGGGVKSDTKSFTVTTPWSIDMSSVIPIPIKSLTFSSNPVSVQSTNQVTGTVTLQSAAVVDTTVFLSSNSQNATVLQSVVVPQGQTSANFQILINNNGIASGGSTVATIQAFEATGIQGQLTITN